MKEKDKLFHWRALIEKDNPTPHLEDQTIVCLFTDNLMTDEQSMANADLESNIIATDTRKIVHNPLNLQRKLGYTEKMKSFRQRDSNANLGITLKYIPLLQIVIHEQRW
jgi:hypothetical protein